jgi:heat-inducible transcriptional repressor
MTADKPFTSATTPGSLSELQKLNERSRTIFRQIVESYLATGDPVGSRNLARHLAHDLVAGLDPQRHVGPGASGLIYAPHTSAGRLPTEVGLRMFVDGLLEIGDLTDDERRQIEAQLRIRREKSVEQVLNDASEMISGLSACAGVGPRRQAGEQAQARRVVPSSPARRWSSWSATTRASRTG